jgi:spore germination protein YaaH
MTAGLLNDPTVLAHHVEELANLVTRDGYDGIDIDYEGLHERDRDAFSSFMERLAARVHAAGDGKILSVDVHPKVSEEDTFIGAKAQDWAALARHADEVRVMCYDQEHDDEPEKQGAVAELPWVDSILRYASSLIPRERLFVGLPFYAYDWKGDKKTWILHEEAMALVRQHGARVEWDDRAKVSRFEYREDGALHRVWFESARSLAPKLELVKEHGAAGVFFWHLGREDAASWKVIRDVLRPAGAVSG